jgi:hypothetical protein
MPLIIGSDPRWAFITGLRDLADYLAAHPAVPVPEHGADIIVHASSTDDGGCAQVDRIARQLDVPVENELAYGHYRAARSFGPVGYRIVAISDHAMARHYAHESYHGYVIPDTWT